MLPATQGRSTPWQAHPPKRVILEDEIRLIPEKLPTPPVVAGRGENVAVGSVVHHLF
jgi:hypothetical protein